MIKIKRVYEDKQRGDGLRVLVDRLWPRGLKKSDLSFDEWPKEICPSSELRESFAHDPKKFPAFKKEYVKELKDEAAQDEIKALAKKSLKRNVTLLYAAHDEKINHAVILKDFIEKEAKKL